MTGSGNDFVMVDGRYTTPADWSVQDIRAVCARHTGVGADGLVFLGPGAEPDVVRMIYFNSDGSRAAMCGNAALHLAPVRTPAPVPGLATAAGERQVALGTVGVPHLVVLVEDVELIDVVTRGRSLRSDPALGPAGANVNFVSAAARQSEWRMRTYERGVEDETLACGTGAVAAACALADWGLAKPPITFWTRSAKRLEIRARRTSQGIYDDVWLGGEARFVVRGVIN